jgi:hypothetical protein
MNRNEQDYYVVNPLPELLVCGFVAHQDTFET